MIRYLTLIEVVELHRQIIEQSGGALGIRDRGTLESALAQPRMTFGGEDLYPTLIDKAAAIGFSLRGCLKSPVRYNFDLVIGVNYDDKSAF